MKGRGGGPWPGARATLYSRYAAKPTGAAPPNCRARVLPAVVRPHVAGAGQSMGRRAEAPAKGGGRRVKGRRGGVARPPTVTSRRSAAMPSHPSRATPPGERQWEAIRDLASERGNRRRGAAERRLLALRRAERPALGERRPKDWTTGGAVAPCRGPGGGGGRRVGRPEDRAPTGTSPWGTAPQGLDYWRGGYRGRSKARAM
jgi:hypothetical protein